MAPSCRRSLVPDRLQSLQNRPQAWQLQANSSCFTFSSRKAAFAPQESLLRMPRMICIELSEVNSLNVPTDERPRIC